ncbi:MAG: hypothetical protein AAGA87_04220 [Pseudomonadota bacterium]
MTIIDALVDAVLLLLKLEAAALAFEVAFLIAVPVLLVLAFFINELFVPNSIPPPKNVVIRELTMKDQSVDQSDQKDAR